MTVWIVIVALLGVAAAAVFGTVLWRESSPKPREAIRPLRAFRPRRNQVEMRAMRSTITLTRQELLGLDIDHAEFVEAVNMLPAVKNYEPPKGLAAAAAVFTRGQESKQAIPPPSAVRMWQNEAWGFFEQVGELNNAATLFGSMMARVDLIPAITNDEGGVDVTFDETETQMLDMAANIMRYIAELQPPFGGQDYIKRQLATNLVVAGECFLYRTDELDGLPNRYEVLSTNELRPIVGGGSSTMPLSWIRYYGPGFQPRRLTQDSFVVRIWNPNPSLSRHPHSSVRALLEVLEELVLLTREVRGEVLSRLSTSGMILFPQEIDMTPLSEDAQDGDEAMSPFSRELIEYMMAPIKDKGSASAVVPHVVEGPADMLDRIKHISFARPDAAIAMAKRREALERFAQGFELPVETIFGHMSTTFSNAAQISDDQFKMYVEPKIRLICEALTSGYLWPRMAADMGADPSKELPPEITRHRIWFDASRLIAKPDKTKDADMAHSKLALSDEAYLRELGFEVSDMPSPDEVSRRINIVQNLNVKETIRGNDTNVMPIQDPNLRQPDVQPGADPDHPMPVPPPPAPALPSAPTGVPDNPNSSAMPANSPGPTPLVSASTDELAVRLASAMEYAAHRAVEKADAKLRNLARANAGMRTIADSAEKGRVALELGPSAVAELIGESGLFAGEFSMFTQLASGWARDFHHNDPGACAEACTALTEELARSLLYDRAARMTYKRVIDAVAATR